MALPPPRAPHIGSSAYLLGTLVLSDNYRNSLGRAGWVTGRWLGECRKGTWQQHRKWICRRHDEWKRNLGPNTMGKWCERGPKKKKRKEKLSQELEAEMDFCSKSVPMASEGHVGLSRSPAPWMLHGYKVLFLDGLVAMISLL